MNYWDPFDWEKKSEVDAVKAKVGDKLPHWATGAEEFFASDPVKINGPPPAPSKKDTKKPPSK